MWRCLIFLIWTWGVGAIALTPRTAGANDLTILVVRMDDATELYFSARADVFLDLFGAAPTVLAQDGNTVDFGQLRNGTFEQGDQLLFDTEILIGARDAEFEAMSLMVHPREDKLQMRTPVEAMISIGVCSGPPVGTVMQIHQLEAYAGYFTLQSSLDQPLSISFPPQPGRTLNLTLHEFGPSGHYITRQMRVNLDRPLLLVPHMPRRHRSLWLVLFAVLAGTSAVITTAIRLKRGPVAFFGP